MLHVLNRPGLGGARGVFSAILLGVASALATAGISTDVAANPRDELKLGYFPIVSTVALFKRFSPLRDYLAESLGRPVLLQTAKDFPTFVERTDKAVYDLVVTAPHFAVRAADSGKYVIRATPRQDVQQLFIVPNDSPVRSIFDLAGKNIATPPESALMTMMGKRYLLGAGLMGGKQPVYYAFTSHNASNQALLARKVDAAISSSNIVRKANKQGKHFRILEGGNKLPNMALLVAKDLDSELGERIASILVNMDKSERGRDVLKQISFPGYRAVDATDYEPARPYMEQAFAQGQTPNN